MAVFAIGRANLGCWPRLPGGRDRRGVVRGDVGERRAGLVGAGRAVGARLRGRGADRGGRGRARGRGAGGGPAAAVRRWLTRLLGTHVITDESVAFALRQPDPARRRSAFWGCGVG